MDDNNKKKKVKLGRLTSSAIAACITLLVLGLCGEGLTGGLRAVFLVLAATAALVAAGSYFSEKTKRQEQEKLDEEKRKEDAQKRKEKKEELEAKKPENIEKLDAEYKELLDQCSQKGVDILKFEENLEKLVNRYARLIGKPITLEHVYAITRKCFFEGHLGVARLFVSTIANRIYVKNKKAIEFNKEHGYHQLQQHVASITARALHFEKHGKSEANYSTLTEETSQEYVPSLNTTYLSIISPELFHFHAKNCISSSRKGWNKTWYLPDVSEDPYFTDAVCHYYLKCCLKQNEIFPTDPAAAYNVIYETLKLTEKDLLEIETKKQCKSCVRCDHCEMRYTRPNCSVYLPK